MDWDFYTMYKDILVAVDGSESNKAAVLTALECAKELGAKITAICVFDIGSSNASVWGMGENKEFMVEAANKGLAFVVNTAAEMGIPLETKISIGRPAEAICVESKNHDLVIVGTHGRTGVMRALIGSVAERVVRMAPVPVLICRDVMNPKEVVN